jgi:hypothetical protein
MPPYCGAPMRNVVPLHEPISAMIEPAQRRVIRHCGGILALILTLLTALIIGAGILLAGAVVIYDGPLLSFGPGGIWIAPDKMAGLLPLTAFSLGQRCAGAIAITLLVAPVAVILWHMRALLRLYAQGRVFTPASAQRIASIATSVLFYAVAPLLANALIRFAGVTSDPTWFHVDEIVACVLAALLFVVAKVMAFGHEIERERDGFV